MKLDYGTQLSPSPISLSIGTLLKPKLKDITNSKKGMSFNKFNYYEVLIKMTPELFYTKIKGESGLEYWNSLTTNEKETMTLYDVVLKEKQLTDSFVDIFNFFFEETVIFKESFFVLLDKNINADINTIKEKDIHGVISDKSFLQVLDIIQQICCIDDNEKNISDLKFKNKLAKSIYEKMQKAAKKQKSEKNNIDFTLPNIISSVSNKHKTISPITVWNLTIFQLLDSFSRLQINTMFDINSTRVSVWGDEKKTFNAALWYKNEYDK